MNLNCILTANNINLLEKFSPISHRFINNIINNSDCFLKENLNLLNFSSAINYNNLLDINSCDTLVKFQKQLRIIKNLIFTKLILFDLKKIYSTIKIMEELSEFAKFSLEKALLIAEKMTKEKFNLNNLNFKPIIMAMGKLGGGELNYSSDIDLVYLFNEEENCNLKTVNYFFNIVTKSIAEITIDGFVFRVDLDLRPLGKDGPLAQNIDAALNSLLTFGRPWERLAWLRAKPIAGDINLGNKFLQELSVFIYRRHLDYLALEELAILKNKMLMEHNVKNLKELNVKLASGGIREMEFLSQSLILTFGGKNLNLRSTSFIKSLKLLADNNILTFVEKEELEEAYLFFRDIEHRLQMVSFSQTHVLAKNGKNLDLISLAMGFENSDVFLEKLKNYQKQSALKFNKLLSIFKVENNLKINIKEEWITEFFNIINIDLEKQKQLLIENGFDDPENAVKDINYIIKASFLPVTLERYEIRIYKLLPLFLEFCSKTPNANLALNRLTKFLAAIGPKAGYLVMLEDNLKLVETLIFALGTSGFLADLIISHPGLLDGQVSSRALVLKKTKEEFVNELNNILMLEEDFEHRLAFIRRYKNEEFLRLGLIALTKKLVWEDISLQLSDLAEAIMLETLILASESVLKRKVVLKELPLAIVFVGKLGAKELNFSSDLDLLFFVLNNNETLGRKIIQRFHNYLTLNHIEGPGYELDLRLRPSGSIGPLTVTCESFGQYHKSSKLWEKQVLTKFRVGLGADFFLSEINDLVKKILNTFILETDANLEINKMWQKVSDEMLFIKKEHFNVKFQKGGLLMAEFLAQYLFLNNKNKENLLLGTYNFYLNLGEEFKELAFAYKNLLTINAFLFLIMGKQIKQDVYNICDLEKIDFLLYGGSEKIYKNSTKIIEDYYNKYLNLI